MKPTEYQKGKYKSLLKEIPELERGVEKQNLKWFLKLFVIIAVVSTVSEIVIDKISSGNVNDWTHYIHWPYVIPRTIFWLGVGYFFLVYGIRSNLKKKKKELAQFHQTCQEL